MSVRILGEFRDYPTGTVYRNGHVIGHRVIQGAPGLDKEGTGCLPGWRIEVDAPGCRDYDLLDEMGEACCAHPDLVDIPRGDIYAGQ